MAQNTPSSMSLWRKKKCSATVSQRRNPVHNQVVILKVFGFCLTPIWVNDPVWLICFRQLKLVGGWWSIWLICLYIFQTFGNHYIQNHWNLTYIDEPQWSLLSHDVKKNSVKAMNQALVLVGYLEAQKLSNFCNATNASCIIMSSGHETWNKTGVSWWSLQAF